MIRIAALSTLLIVASSHAQNFEQMMQYNMQQQAALEAQMNQQMMNTQANLDTSIQNYIQQDRANLEREHQQYVQSTGMQISLEQYVRNKVMQEATRRNAANAPSVNPMFEQQKQMFEAGQQRYQASQQQFQQQNNNWAAGQQQIDANNQAWVQGQRQIDSNHNRFVQGAIQGNQYYRNTETGQVAELPFANSPGVYQNGNDDTWVSPSMGQYYQMNPQGMRQEMEAFEPEYYGED